MGRFAIAGYDAGIMIQEDYSDWPRGAEMRALAERLLAKIDPVAKRLAPSASFEFHLSPAGDGWVGFVGYSTGQTEAEAKSIAEIMLRETAEGLETSIRVDPCVETVTNFETMEKEIRGYVRFAFRQKEGKWTRPIANDDTISAPISFGRKDKRDDRS
jgi:hypothetical protein